MEHLTSVPDLTGRVALVTGGGRGLGRAFAQSLARAGASVGVLARTETELADTVDSITATHARATAVAADVTDEGAVRRAVGEVERRLGPVDVLVNNAGVTGPLGPAWEIDGDAWWRAMDVNVRGAFLCARAVLPGMIARRRGRIINISSGASTVAIPYMSAYVTSKTALTRLSEVLAAEVREHGVSVFGVEPGTVRTAMAEYALTSPEGQRWMPWFGDIFAAHRDVPASVAADLVVVLATGAADALSGLFISRADNVARLLRHLDEIAHRDLYALRLRTLV